jgi:hypothetical protein
MLPCRGFSGYGKKRRRRNDKGRGKSEYTHVKLPRKLLLQFGLHYKCECGQRVPHSRTNRRVPDLKQALYALKWNWSTLGLLKRQPR